MSHEISNTHPQRLVAAGGLLLALAACSPSRTDMTSPASTSEPAARQQEGPVYRQNPHPQQAYRITMTIENAPGPFAHMLGLAQFDVVNPECLPPPDDNDGHTWPVPTEGVEIPLQKVADNTYSGVVYADQMLDEDYFGHGVCRWKLIQAQVQLKATGAKDETKFIADYPDAKLSTEEPETVYFNKISYPRFGESEPSEYESVSFGLNDRSRFGPTIRDEDLFTVMFTSRKE
jgi:hypothetical protein